MALNDTLILMKCGGVRSTSKQATTSKTQTKKPTRRKREIYIKIIS